MLVCAHEHEPMVGDIYKEKSSKGTLCYVTYRNDSKNNVIVFYPDGYSYTWTMEGFKANHDFTGENLPLEAITEIIFVS